MSEARDQLFGCAIVAAFFIGSLWPAWEATSWLCGSVTTWRGTVVWLIVFSAVYPVTAGTCLAIGEALIKPFFASDDQKASQED